jgi:hypothetical protein
MHLALIRPGCPILGPLPGLLLLLKGMEGYGGLVHGDSVVQDHQELPLKKLKEVLAVLDWTLPYFWHWTAV